MNGLRVLVTGKTRSGKSTTLHRLVCHTVRLQNWGKILIIDGKGSELGIYKDVPGVSMYGPQEIEKWADELDAMAKAMPARYAALAARGLQKAAEDDARNLIIVDEVQIGTRSPKFGKRIRDALAILFEQAAALDDVFIVATQRDVNAVPPAVRHNSNVSLIMLGQGYFQYHADGLPTRTGRVKFLTRQDAINFTQRMVYSSYQQSNRRPITVENIPGLLGAADVVPSRAPAVLFVGAPGTGRTHALRASSNGHRAVYVDFREHHRAVLVSVLEQCNAVAPQKADVGTLAECAALALHSEHTSLMMDNIDLASERTITTSIIPMINAASDVWLAADDTTAAKQLRLQPLFARCKIEKLKPVPADVVKTIIWQKLDPATVKNPRAVEARIIQLSHGHPATAAALADRIKSGGPGELRELAAPQIRINIIWVVLLALLIGLYMFRWSINETFMAAILFVFTLLARRFFMRSISNTH